MEMTEMSKVVKLEVEDISSEIRDLLSDEKKVVFDNMKKCTQTLITTPSGLRCIEVLGVRSRDREDAIKKLAVKFSKLKNPDFYLSNGSAVDLVTGEKVYVMYVSHDDAPKPEHGTDWEEVL